MKPLRLGQVLVALAFVIGGCGTPRKIHVDGGNDGADGAKDRVDVPGDQPTGGDVDGPSDVPGEGVVVVPPGSVDKGKPCSTDTDCASGFCRDDVCCADKCEGTCMACAAAFTTLDNGTCGPVVGGMDPRGVCTDQSATTQCGQDGTCDGAGACRKQGPDHVCASAACSTDGKFTAASTCDGKGTCVTGMTMACGAVACVITGCAKPCAGDNDCPTGNFCANGTCKIKKIVGESCDNQNQCGTGNCSPDKVCCDTACTGACTACTEALTGQKNGTCASVQAGKDPKDNCSADDPKSCGHDGTCDGKGGCRYYDSSVACSDPACTGSMFSPASACDSKGACAPVTPVECGQSMCTPSGCKKMCASSSDCAAGSYCITVTQSCAPKKANGIACGGGGECGSGACVDGICCESACQGKCYACSSEKTGQANGRCLPVTAGSDPDTECDSSDSTTCGQDGACDGRGQCRKWASGTQCAAAMCTADNKYVATRTCDGSGTCAPATPDDCGASACALTGCKRMCNGNQDCTGTNYCDPMTKICTAQKNMGVACKTGVECVSQSCVDGVCCESACASKCYACSNDKTGQTSGRCQPITSQTDPDNECDSSDQTTCGQDGTCNGNGQCRKWNPGTMCGAASCTGNQYQPSRSCDGNGTCSARSVQDCGGATCDATGCKGSCANDGECFGNNYCDLVAHTCAAKKNLGSPCGTGVECLSLFCADGVCCNSACNGKCNACVKEKTGLSTSGTCGAIPAGSDPDNECTASDASTCGLDGSCDGSGQCRQWPSGTQCAGGMCASNAYTAPRTCDGQGICGAKSPKDCTPSTCGANGCKVSCSTAADCTSGNYCDSSMMCAPLKSLGSTCTTTTECLSGICADGVCCNTGCDKACQACNLPNSKGTCTPVSGNPPAGHPTCAGTDAGCNGTCAGSADGQCAFPTNSCGTCKGCFGGACQTVVNQVNSGCAGICDASGVCKSNKGQLCSIVAAGCVSGTVCAPDGICCDRACSGACEACDIQGFSGTCTAVSSGAPHSQHPTCGSDPACFGSCADGQCSYQTKPCGQGASCSGSTYSGPSACNNGSCMTPPPSSCSMGFLCSGSACASNCSSDADCQTNYFCSNSKCHLDAVGLASGGAHSCAILSNGNVWCWGLNAGGALGNGTNIGGETPVQVLSISNVSQVSAGNAFTCARLNSGGIKCWGANSSGALGDGTLAESHSPVQVSGLTAGVTDISAGADFACAALSGGSVKCWGNNSQGNLGDGSKTSSKVPISVTGLSGALGVESGFLHACALVTGGGIQCWGYNGSGELGIGSSDANAHTATPIINLNGNAIGLNASIEYSCALISGGALKCWGYNQFGQLGIGTTDSTSSPMAVNGVSNVIAVATGSYHTCALVAGGTVACWGDNSQGELGDGTQQERHAPVAVAGLTGVAAISAGSYFTCALLNSGAVKCWGKNDAGQLGLGNVSASPSLTPVTVSGW